MKRSEIKKLALSAVVCSLSVVLCIIGCLFDIADMSVCAVASGLLFITGIEIHGKYPILIYAVTSAIMLMLFPSHSATIFYIAFFGFYPLVKSHLEKLPKFLIYAAKLLLFNLCIVLMFKFAAHIFVAEGEMPVGTVLLAALVLANIFFVVYDMALTVFSLSYTNHFRKIWGIDKLMK